MSEEVAEAIGDLTYWRKRAQEAEALEAYWKQKHADAWVLIGRLDYALEQIGVARGMRDVRGWAWRMRQEIKDRTGKETI